MDLITQIGLTLPALVPWLPYVVAAAAILSAMLPPPTPPADGSPATGVYAGVHRLVNLLAVNKGYARNATG